MNVYVSKKHWASLLWGVLLITNECMWTKQGKHHWGVYKNTLRHETLFQTKTRPGLSLFHEGILPLIDLSWSTWVESFPKHLSQSHQCWHLTPAWLEPERAAQFSHSSTRMLHNPTSSNQVLVSDTFNSNTWDIDNWKNETLQHETCKLNLPCPPEPIGNPDISSEEMLHIVAWGCTWHGCWIEGNNHKYEGRNERENIFISIHVSIY